MKKWERIVDRLITDSIGDGDVSHLPGAGKKLSLKDDSSTPGELRAAFKIMQDHNVTPEWIEVGVRLEQMESALRSQIETRARRYLSEKNSIAADQAARGESSWKGYIEKFRDRIERYNRDVLLYNLKLPVGISHRQTLNAEALIQRALRKEAET